MKEVLDNFNFKLMKYMKSKKKKKEIIIVNIYIYKREKKKKITVDKQPKQHIVRFIDISRPFKKKKKNKGKKRKRKSLISLLNIISSNPK